jgi:hypothetical protein
MSWAKAARRAAKARRERTREVGFRGGTNGKEGRGRTAVDGRDEAEDEGPHAGREVRGESVQDGGVAPDVLEDVETVALDDVLQCDVDCREQAADERVDEDSTAFLHGDETRILKVQLGNVRLLW